MPASDRAHEEKRAGSSVNVIGVFFFCMALIYQMRACVY